MMFEIDKETDDRIKHGFLVSGFSPELSGALAVTIWHMTVYSLITLDAAQDVIVNLLNSFYPSESDMEKMQRAIWISKEVSKRCNIGITSRVISMIRLCPLMAIMGCGIEGWLSAIDNGETVDAIENRIKLSAIEAPIGKLIEAIKAKA